MKKDDHLTLSSDLIKCMYENDFFKPIDEAQPLTLNDNQNIMAPKILLSKPES